MFAVAAKLPMMELPVPAAERTFSTSLAATRITPYGPEGRPAWITPGAAVAATAPGTAVVTAGRISVGIGLATTGAAEAVGGSVAAATVGVD